MYAIRSYYAQSLARLDGRDVRQANGQTMYDSRLTEAVERFQARMGLMVDGVVGPQTGILLSTQTGSGLPLLFGRAGR